MIDAGKLITKLEFHEFHNKRQTTVPAVELYCYIEDLPTFLALCVGPEEWAKQYSTKFDYEYNMKRLEKSRAQRPHFNLYLKHEMGGVSIIVYPKENLVVYGVVGLHYICQHIFDFLPYEIKERFYPVVEWENFLIGKLHIDHGKHQGETLDVKALDITKGFMLTIPEIKEYSDKFSEWISYRRLQEKIKNGQINKART